MNRFFESAKNKRYDKHPQLLDIHVDRMIEAHRLVSTYMRDTELLKSGFIKLEGFLGWKMAGRVYEQGMESRVKDGRMADTMVVNLPDSPAYEAAGEIFPVVMSVFQEHIRPEVKFLFAHQTYLQHLLNAPDDGDEQKVYHSDTFFPNVKFWYFPRKVEVQDGPFWYVPYSVQLTEKLIEWHKQRVEDLKAGREEEWRGPSHRQGSFRINDAELAGVGLKGEPVTVEGDTLVIANVFGFHKRGDTTRESHRVAVHGNLRLSNPFEYEKQ